MPGLTPTGLDALNLAEAKTSLEDALRTRLGNSLNFLPSAVNAQVIGVVAEQLRDVWEALADMYAGLDPDNASGVLLEYLCAITGIERSAATKSTATLTLDLDATTTVPAGSLVSHSTTGAQFTTEDAVTSTTAGTYDVTAKSVETGPIEASSGTLTEIDSPVTGWNSVTNSEDATPGSAEETDSELRIRRAQSIAIRGGSTVDAIVADVGSVDDVTVVRGYENTSASIDSDGRPPHSIEIVVLDNAASDDEIAQAIWDSKAGGIESHSGSSDSGSATDDTGSTQTVAFTRATEIDIHVEIDLEKNSDYAGDSAVESAILDALDENTIGTDQYASALYAAVFTVAGVVNITDVQIDTSASPSGSSVALAYDETPNYDSSRVTVNSSDV